MRSRSCGCLPRRARRARRCRFAARHCRCDELTEYELRGRRHRAVFRRRQHLQALRAARGACRRHRHRQLLGISHGPERAAGGARDQPAGDRRARRHHRQPQLLRDHFHHAAVADPSGEPHHAADQLRPTRRPRVPARRRWRSCASPRAPTSRVAPTSTRCCRILMPSTSSATTPTIDPATGYNDEETKVIQETRKIFGDPQIRVTATCVRVPVLRAHCHGHQLRMRAADHAGAGARAAAAALRA